MFCIEVKITASRLFLEIISLKPLRRFSYSLSVKGKDALGPLFNLKIELVKFLC